MKKLLLICLMLVIASCSKVPAGNIGVKVYLLGADKGVDQEELGVGRYWIGINEELYLFPTFLQNYVWTKSVEEGSLTDESLSFQSKEGLVVNCDIGISYSVIPTKVGEVFQKYRRGIDEITDVFLRNEVRDALVKAASTKPIDYIYGEGKSELMKTVLNVVQENNKDYFNIQQIYLIGELRLPSEITALINAKIGATQKALMRENEIVEAEAEAKKKIAEAEGKAQSVLLVAEAEAKAIKLKNEALKGSDEYIALKLLESWDGKYPQIMMGGNTQIPMMDISKLINK